MTDPRMTDPSNAYSRNVFALLAFLGVVVKWCFPGQITADGSSGPAAAAIWGYGLIAVSVAGMSFTATGADPVKTSLTNMLSNGFLFIVLVVLISLNNSFYTRINQGLVADEFNQFSTLAAVMITLQLIVIGKEETVSSDAIKKRDRWITYLLSMFSLIFAAMQAVILKYYSTEG